MLEFEDIYRYVSSNGFTCDEDNRYVKNILDGDRKLLMFFRINGPLIFQGITCEHPDGREISQKYSGPNYYVSYYDNVNNIDVVFKRLMLINNYNPK